MWGAFTTALAQSHITLKVDNDLYFASDFYYSSGIFVQQGKEKTGDSLATIRRFRQWELGQLIYTPSKRYATSIETLDYPFSGLLYVRYSQDQIVRDQWGFSYGAELGISGDASLAKAVQNLYHEWVLQLPHLSWIAQMPQQLHIDFQTAYFRSFRMGKHVALVPDLLGVLSTHQTQMAARLGLVLGSTAKIPWDANPLLNTQKGWGLYLGWRLQYVAHDFPLEGSVFDDQAVFTLTPNRGRNRFEIGMTYHNEKWKLQSTLLSSSQDTASQRDPRHEYLNISISRFF